MTRWNWSHGSQLRLITIVRIKGKWHGSWISIVCGVVAFFNMPGCSAISNSSKNSEENTADENGASWSYKIPMPFAQSFPSIHTYFHQSCPSYDSIWGPSRVRLSSKILLDLRIQLKKIYRPPIVRQLSLNQPHNLLENGDSEL